MPRAWRWSTRRVLYRSNVELDSFWICGGCVAPQAVCALRVGLSQVEDLGCQPREPELVFFDSLVRRVRAGEEVGTVASSQVARALVDLMAEWRRESTPYAAHADQPSFSFGQLAATSVTREGSGAVLQITADEVTRLTVRLERRAGSLYASAITIERP